MSKIERYWLLFWLGCLEPLAGVFGKRNAARDYLVLMEFEAKALKLNQ